jgi:hypothetical protein
VEADEPVAASLGDRRATRIDLRVPSDLDLQACRLWPAGFEGVQVWFAEISDKYFVLLPDAEASVYILELDGERQVFLTQHRTATSASDLAELEAILASIRFEP